jgi:magnesium chelatase subunit ChlD-like protein
MNQLCFKDPCVTPASLHCVLVDCSASMLSGRRLAQAKGFLMQLIQEAYEQAADVAIVTFAADQATVVLQPTRAKPQTSQSVSSWLKPLRGGGGTPLLKGIEASEQLLARSRHLKPLQSRWLWLLSDGRSRDTPAAPAAAAMRVVVDCESQRVPLRRCRLIAQRWGAHYLSLEEFEHGPG